MFNGLFTTLFGKSKENNFSDASEANNNNNREYREDFDASDICDLDGNVRVILLDDDKDWLFVETETQYPSLLSPSSIEVNDLNEDEEEKENSSIDRQNNLQLVPFKSILSHLSASREYDENCLLSANLPALYPNTMDESWFLTPPSSFSSASIQLESSPIENLLIEHPSMSVYHNIRRRRSLNGVNNEDIEDLVVLELSSHVDNDDAQMIVNTFKGNCKRKNKNGKKSRPTSTQNGNQKSVALVLITKNGVSPKSADQRGNVMTRSFFDRNNKTARNSYKKNLHTINQPSSRTVIRKN